MQLGIKAIGFDLDGTLIKTHVDYDALRVADIEVFKAHGIPYEEIYGAMDHTERLRKPLKAWLEANDEGDRFQDISDEIDALYTSIEMKYVDEATPFPGSRECIEKIHANGMKVGVLTRGSLGYARTVLEQCDMLDCMDAVMGRDNTGYDDAKPSPKAMYDFASMLGVEPEEILYIGDNPADFHCARDAGSMFIGVLSGTADSELWEKESPGMMTLDYAGSIMDILEFLI
jgi:phosphoglycolate phosphatase-like HAD superfamily hydrolase